MKKQALGRIAAAVPEWLTRVVLTGVVASAAVLVSSACGTSAAKSKRTTAGRGGTLTIAEAAYPSSFNPAQSGGDFVDLAYDPLIVQTTSGSYAPGLATEWSYGPNNKSFAITLRSGVHFSDGSLMTAAGVKAWLMYEKTYAGSVAQEDFGTLSSITVRGKLHLTLHFKAPTPNMTLYLSQSQGIGEIASPKAISSKTLDSGTDGSGEYMLDKAKTVAQETYTYVPNPHYWNRSAIHWKKIVIKTIESPSAALSALQTGQAQIARVQPITSAAAAKKAGLKVSAAQDLLMGLALENRGSGPLANQDVRKALNYAVNRVAIAKLLGVGYGIPTDQMAVPGDDSYDPALKNYYTYNPAKAKQLLAQGGYPNGFTLPVLTTVIAQQNTLEQVLQGELAAIGVQLQPTTETDVNQYETELGTSTYPAITLSWGRLPAAANYLFLWGPNGQSSKPFGTTNSRMNLLYGELIEASPTEESGVARQMQKLLVHQAWYLPVAGTPLANFYRKTVTGVNATAARPTVYLPEVAPATK